MANVNGMDFPFVFFFSIIDRKKKNERKIVFCVASICFQSEKRAICTVRMWFLFAFECMGWLCDGNRNVRMDSGIGV